MYAQLYYLYKSRKCGNDTFILQRRITRKFLTYYILNTDDTEKV